MLWICWSMNWQIVRISTDEYSEPDNLVHYSNAEYSLDILAFRLVKSRYMTINRIQIVYGWLKNGK